VRLIRWLKLWLTAMFRRDRADADLEREMRFHIERETELNVARGMRPEDARRTALVAFGGVAQAKEAVIDERRTVWVEQMISDARYAVRVLLRRPAFAIVAIATIALSIGATTAIYSLVDSVLFRSIPGRGPGQLVAVWQTIPEWRGQPTLASWWSEAPLDYQDFRNWRARQTSFSSVAAWTGGGATLWTEGHPEQVLLTRASPSLFTVLGAVPALGRFFLPGEDVYEGPHVAVLSYGTWQSRFGARRDVIGRAVLLDSVPYEVVGVLPQDFALVRGEPPRPFFVPAGQESADRERGMHMYRAIGRLKSGVTTVEASSEANQLLGGDTEDPKRGARVVDYHVDQTRTVRSPLLLLLAASAMLVLIAVLNIATLLLGEAATRELEMSARVALGASRGRLIRQMLTESVILAVTGAALGVAVAWWAVRALVTLAPSTLPGVQLASIDGHTLAATTAVTVIAGVLFGLVPALSLSMVAPSDLLRGGRTMSGRGLRAPSLFMTLQVSLSLVLLVGAGLVSRSLRALSQADRGFDSNSVAVVSTAYPFSAFRTEAARQARIGGIVARLAALPGVLGVSGASTIPFDNRPATNYIELPGDQALGPRAPKRNANRRIVLPNFFSMLRIPLLAGRSFTAADRGDATPVMIVSEALARREWPSETALGKQVNAWGHSFTVVGVVADTKRDKLSDDAEPTFYIPYAQQDADIELLVKTARDPIAAAHVIRAAITDASPLSAVTSMKSMDDLVRASMADERFRTTLIDLFGVMALTLAAVGLFGLTSRAVARRTREAAIRIALGATAASVSRLIVGRTLRLVATGAMLGTVIAIPVTRLLAPYLFGITTGDRATYVAAAVTLAIVALVASGLPVRRIGRMSPIRVLRAD
jgi:predicted permease